MEVLKWRYRPQPTVNIAYLWCVTAYESRIWNYEYFSNNGGLKQTTFYPVLVSQNPNTVTWHKGNCVICQGKIAVGRLHYCNTQLSPFKYIIIYFNWGSRKCRKICYLHLKHPRSQSYVCSEVMIAWVIFYSYPHVDAYAAYVYRNYFD